MIRRRVEYSKDGPFLHVQVEFTMPSGARWVAFERFTELDTRHEIAVRLLKVRARARAMRAFFLRNGEPIG